MKNKEQDKIKKKQGQLQKKKKEQQIISADASLMPEEKIIINLHKWSESFLKTSPDWNNVPSIFKKIATEKVKLPRKFKKLELSVGEAIKQRVSRRDYKGKVTLKEVAQLLFYANGFKEVVDGDQYGLLYRSNAPSAGSRHPIELYVILREVVGIKDGVYHYDVENHQLEIINQDKVSDKTVLALLNNQQPLLGANMILVMTAIYKRTAWKYGSRAYRFIHLDAGHIGQNIYLTSEALGLGVTGVGGWQEVILKKLLRIDGVKELPVYILTIGGRF